MTNEITKHNTWKNALQAQDGAASDAAVTALSRLLLVNDANSQDELIQLLRAEGDLVFLARLPLVVSRYLWPVQPSERGLGSLF